MKILYLTHTVSWKGGGIFFAAWHQARLLSRRGHEVTLVSISPRARAGMPECMTEGVRIVESPDLLFGPGRTGWDPWDTLNRIRFIDSRKYDIVHGFESRPAVALPAFYARRKLHVPVVMTWADLFGKGGRSEQRQWPIRAFMPPIEDFFERYFYPRADFTIAMGAPLLNMALERGIPRERLMSLLHGCDVEGIRAFAHEEARAALSNTLPEDAAVLGYLGYLWSVNADLLFGALRCVKQMLKRPVKLVLIGNHRANLGKLLPADLREDVIETGWVSYKDINLYLCASDLLMLPLKCIPVSERIWPSKLNDYLAAGRPVVATDMPILRPVQHRKPFGCLTEDTPEAVACAAVSLLEDPAAMRALGENGRCLAEQELSWERIVDQIEDLYCRLVAESKRA